jgi:hypothetical protein
MKPMLLSLLVLLLVGCATTPQGNLTIGLPVATDDPQRAFGYVVDSDAWSCTRATDAYGDCDTCRNISGRPAELSTGRLLDTGEWDVRREVFKPGAIVWLCQPHVKRMAEMFYWALYQHLNHEPQTTCKVLKIKES